MEQAVENLVCKLIASRLNWIAIPLLHNLSNVNLPSSNTLYILGIRKHGKKHTPSPIKERHNHVRIYGISTKKPDKDITHDAGTLFFRNETFSTATVSTPLSSVLS